MTEFDPTEHTVAEVQEHLADADPVETARVVALEQNAEKPRKGVTDLAPPPEVLENPDRPQEGDSWEGEDGYTRVVVSS